MIPAARDIPLRTILGCLLVTVVIHLLGCATNPVVVAQTAEQRAYAAYGEFTVAEEQCAVLMASPSVSDSAKLTMQKADAAVKPVADTTIQLARAVTTMRADVAAGKTPADQLNVLNANLLVWLNQLLPLVAQLKTEVHQ